MRRFDPQPIDIALFTAIILAAAVIGLNYAYARAPEGLAPDPARAEWFRGQTIPGTQTNPDDPASGLSCCNESDGRVVDYRIVKGHWEIYMTNKLWPDAVAAGHDHWQQVPDKAVLQHQHNPTGGAVAWVLNGYSWHGYQNGDILCFSAPPMG
jgi:hypothetical protein